MRFFNALIIFILYFSVGSSFAAEESNDFWLGTFTKKSITENYSFWTEAQMRFDLDESNMQQTLFRTGILKSISTAQSIGLLYAYIETGDQSEHRLALQHTQKYGAFFNTSASHRIRLEGRRFENVGFGSIRFRYLARLQAQTSRSFKPVLWNEIFLNLKEEERTGSSHIDRNRFFIGFRKKIGETTHIEFGYLNQYVSRPSGDNSEHVIVFYLFL